MKSKERWIIIVLIYAIIMLLYYHSYTIIVIIIYYYNLNLALSLMQIIGRSFWSPFG